MRILSLIILIFGYNGIPIGHSQSTNDTGLIRSSCGQIYNTENGTIDYRNYPNNANCSWTIQSSEPDNRISINFDLFSTERNHDYLLITEGGEGSSKQYKLTGRHNFYDFISRTNTLILLFMSDGSGTSLGFKLNYKFIKASEIPCGGVFEEDNGIISYAFHPNNTNCTWNIHSKDEYDKIEISFESEFHLETNFLTAIDLKSGAVEFNLTGHNKPNEIYILESNTIIINFQSRGSINNNRFKLKYRIIRDTLDCCLPDSKGLCRDGVSGRDHGHCGFGVCGLSNGCGGCWGGCRIKNQGAWSANLFEDRFFRREMGLVWGDTIQTCVDLKSYFGDDKTNKLSSINSLGRCVYIYSGHNCTGSFEEIKPGGTFHNNLADTDFDDMTKSISSCQYIEPIIKTESLEEEYIWSDEPYTQKKTYFPETTLKPTESTLLSTIPRGHSTTEISIPTTTKSVHAGKSTFPTILITEGWQQLNTTVSSNTERTFTESKKIVDLKPPETSNSIGAGGVFVIIFLIILIVIIGWFLYALKFPHTSSGQLLTRLRIGERLNGRGRSARFGLINQQT